MSMVNLMPPAQKEAIKYARRNTVLVEWITAIGVGALIVLFVAGGGIFYLKQETNSYSNSIADTTKYLDEQAEEATLERVKEIDGNLKLVHSVLSSQLMLADLIERVGLVMPEGTILQDLNVDSTLEGSIDMQIIAVNEEAATQAQVNLNDPDNEIFSKADIISLTCSQPGEESIPGYLCTASLRAIFDKENNPFLLINQEGGDSES